MPIRWSRSDNHHDIEALVSAGAERLEQIRDQHSWLSAVGTTLCVRTSTTAEWWTFGGTRANATMAAELSRLVDGPIDHDAFTVSLEGNHKFSSIERRLRN